MRLIRRWSVFAFFVCSFSLGALAQIAARSAPGGPQLKIDLRKLGYETPTNPAMRWRTFIDFIDDDHLAISWLTTRKRTTANPSEPTELHVLVIDVRTGEKSGLQSFPTPHSAVRFAGMHDGGFVICIGGLLRSFSRDFVELRKLQLAADHGCDGQLSASGVSPSRKVLLLSSRVAPQEEKETLLGLGTFAPISEWQEKCRPFGISDHWMVGRCGETKQLSIRSIDKAWQPFLPVPDRVGAAAFVGDETLAFGTKDKVAVATADGKILFQDSIPDHGVAMEFATSLEGARFAVIEGKLRGLRSEPLDMYPFLSEDLVVVYTIPEGRAIFVTKVKGTSPWSPWALHLNRVAFSPSGALLALFCDHVLRLYRLPEGDARESAVGRN